jgi:hypothetical protein
MPGQPAAGKKWRRLSKAVPNEPDEEIALASLAQQAASESSDDSDEDYAPFLGRKRSLPKQSAKAARKAGPANKRGTPPSSEPTAAAAPQSQPAGEADKQQRQQTEPSHADSDGTHTGLQMSPPVGDRPESLSGAKAPALPPNVAPAMPSKGKTGNKSASGPAGTPCKADSVTSAGGGSGGSAGPAASGSQKTTPAAGVVPGQRKIFQLAIGPKAQTEASATLAAKGSVPKPKALPAKPKPRPAGPSAADEAASRAVLARYLRGGAEQQQQSDASPGQQPHMSTEPAGGSNSADGAHTHQPVSMPACAGEDLPEWLRLEEAILAGTLPEPQPSSPQAGTPTSGRMPVVTPFRQQQAQRSAPSRQPSDPRLGTSAAPPTSAPWSPVQGWQQQRQASLGNAGVPYTAATAAPAPAMKREPASLRNHGLPALAQPAEPTQRPQQQPAAQLAHSTLQTPWATQQHWPAWPASGLAVPGHGLPSAAQQPQQQPVAGTHVPGAAATTETRMPAVAFVPLTAAAVVAVKHAEGPDTLRSRRWVSLSIV